MMWPRSARLFVLTPRELRTCGSARKFVIISGYELLPLFHTHSVSLRQCYTRHTPAVVSECNVVLKDHTACLHRAILAPYVSGSHSQGGLASLVMATPSSGRGFKVYLPTNHYTNFLHGAGLNSYIEQVAPVCVVTVSPASSLTLCTPSEGHSDAIKATCSAYLNLA